MVATAPTLTRVENCEPLPASLRALDPTGRGPGPVKAEPGFLTSPNKTEKAHHLHLRRRGRRRAHRFLCHQTKAAARPVDGPDLVCRGWLAVHADSPAVRLAVVTGQIDPAEPHRDPGVGVYPSGLAAAEAGLAAVDNPPPAARSAIAKLTSRGIGEDPTVPDGPARPARAPKLGA